MPQREIRSELLRARIKALSHELRLSIIGVLWEQPASAIEVAATLGEPVDKIRYQLRILLDAGLIELHLERRRRGTVERVYTTCERELNFTGREMFSISEQGRSTFALHLLKAVFRSSLRAVSTGAMASRESLIYWRPIRVDAKGLEDLRAIHAETMQQVQGVKAESAKRLGELQEGISVTSIVVWFQTPGRDK